MSNEPSVLVYIHIRIAIGIMFLLVCIVLANQFSLILTSGAVNRDLENEELFVSKVVLDRFKNIESRMDELEQENKELRVDKEQRFSKLEIVIGKLLKENEQLRLDNDAFRKRIYIMEKQINNDKNRIVNSKTESTKHRRPLSKSYSSPDRTRNFVQFKNQDNKPSKTENASFLGYFKNKEIIRPEKVHYETHPNDRNRRLLLPVGTSSPIGANRNVAFSAHLSGHLTSLGNQQTIHYDIINLNEGGAYDKQTGTFVCPITGTYLFIASLMSYPGEETSSLIMVNGKARSDLYAYDQGKWSQTSNSIIIRCNENDHVWMVHGGHGTKIWGNFYSHFAGLLLWT